jgi:hypothetical protein
MDVHSVHGDTSAVCDRTAYDRFDQSDCTFKFNAFIVASQLFALNGDIIPFWLFLLDHLVYFRSSVASVISGLHM